MDKVSALMHSALARQSAGDMDGAAAIYKKILRLKPDSIEALCNLGSALHSRGLLSEAISCYQNALAVDPRIPELYYNMAGAQQALGHLEQAGENLAHAIKLKPDYMQALFSLGMLDIQRNRHETALTHFTKLLSLAPGSADALNGIGICKKHLGDSAGALSSFQQALQTDARHFQALANLAVEVLAQGAPDESIRISERALTLVPDDPKLLYNLGIAHKQNKNFTEAISCFRKTLETDPNAVYARLELSHTLQSVCDWRDDAYTLHATATLVRNILDTAADADIDLFNSLCLPVDCATLQQIAKRKSEAVACKAARYRNKLDPTSYTETSRLRVAYLSPDYRNHPAIQLMGGLFLAHDRDNFEIFAYSLGQDDASIYRRRAEAEPEHFIDLYDKSIEQCIERIRADRIHILVDLAGYTTGARPEILAARSAPVQVSYLGFAGTLGADFFDYIVTDSVISPPSYQQFFNEKFAYLPHCYQINDDRDKAADTAPPKSEHGLPENAFVFCCFNNNYKIDPEIFDAWVKILLQVPASVLWLLKGSELQMKNLRREAKARNLDPDRIIFAEPTDKATHLARHTHADLFLDTLYYNAHTTGSDALRQGVPMITCQGDTFASRVGSSLLQAVGLDELITTDLNQYIDVAVKLGTDPVKMGAVRNKLSRNLPESSLLDNPRFARSLERLYKIMWKQFASGQTPQQISPDRSV